MSPRRPLRLLHVEDSTDDSELLRRTLRRAGYDLDYRRVETADAMSAALDEGGWEVILSDYRLPLFGARPALALLRRREMAIPFLIVSGTIEERDAAECLQAGARGFFLKGELDRLPEALARELEEDREGDE